MMQIKQSYRCKPLLQSESVHAAALQTAPFTSTVHQAKSSEFTHLCCILIYRKKKKRYKMQNMLFSLTFILPLRIKSSTNSCMNGS